MMAARDGDELMASNDDWLSPTILRQSYAEPAVADLATAEKQLYEACYQVPQARAPQCCLVD